jgi:hypothetical protein
MDATGPSRIRETDRCDGPGVPERSDQAVLCCAELWPWKATGPMRSGCAWCVEGVDNPPWGMSGEDPSYSLCPCCGVEFGYGDASLAGMRRWREQWLQDPGWQRPLLRPAGWTVNRQIAQLPDRVT